MKSEVKPVEKKSDKPFPKLMISDDKSMVVLFDRDKIGNIVYTTDKEHYLMEYREDFVMDKFTDFTGTVTLSND